jgi:response regulator RpfG family c-di-GMP phosphodiesterase
MHARITAVMDIFEQLIANGDVKRRLLLQNAVKFFMIPDLSHRLHRLPRHYTICVLFIVQHSIN